MPAAKLTSKGQITIPVEVRESLGLKAGDRVDFFETSDGKYTFQPKTGSIMEMKGILKRLGLVPPEFSLSIEEMNQAVLDRATELDTATKSDAVKENSGGKVA